MTHYPLNHFPIKQDAVSPVLPSTQVGQISSEDRWATQSLGLQQAQQLTTTPELSSTTSNSLTLSDLERFAEDYLSECQLSLNSPKTITTRRVFIRCLLWFLRQREYSTCGVTELRQFFYYLAHGHEEPGGRFGNRQLTRSASPMTIRDYYICLRSLFKWMQATGMIQETPFVHIPKPLAHENIKAPLSMEQVERLLHAARQSTEPTRDTALILFLLDTGCRAGELVSLTLEDLDLLNHCCEVSGKGNKKRVVYFGEQTAVALKQYLTKTNRLQPDGLSNASTSILFLPLKGSGHFTVSGLRCVLRRLSKIAGLKMSCSPHAFRRTFAVQTLRNGANVFSVQAMLGHTNLEMTRRYCRIAQADVATQHRDFGPVDRLPVDRLTAITS